MKNEKMNNQIFNEEYIEKITQAVDVDISKDMETIKSMVPMEGYQTKIDLINSAEDMSTKEKLQALDKADEEHLKKVEQAAMIHNGVRVVNVRNKVTGAIVLLGGLVAIRSPEGQKLIKTVFQNSKRLIS